MKKKTGTWIFPLAIIGLFLFLVSSCKKDTPKSEADYTGQKGTVTDIDGNIYHTIGIGKQIWMVENLRTTRFKDGIPIPLVTDSAAWSNLATPGYCYYQNDTAYKNIYGALYNWFAVSTGKLAPNGWHVPTYNELTALIDFLEGTQMFIAGGKMKSPGTIEAGTGLWHAPNSHATNSSGFTALPGGFRGGGNFKGIGYIGEWWTASEYESNTIYAWSIGLIHNSQESNPSFSDKLLGLGIRCVRDQIN
jgi:uncharacterized protein (TIGR02145 family)